MNQTTLSAISLEGSGNDGWFSIAGELTPQGKFEITLFVDKHDHKMTFADDTEQEIATATKKLARFLRDSSEKAVGQPRSDSNSIILEFSPFEKQLQRLVDAIRETLQMDSRQLIASFLHKGETYSFSGKFYYVPGLYSIPGYYALSDRWTHLGKDPSPEQYETIRCLDGVRSVDLVPLIGMTDHAFDIYIKSTQLDETLSEIIATLAK